MDVRHMLLVEDSASDLMKAEGIRDSVRVLPHDWYTKRTVPDDLHLARALVLTGQDVDRVKRVVREVSLLNPEMCIYLVTAKCSGGDMRGLARAGVHDCFGVSRSEVQRLGETLKVLIGSSFRIPFGVIADISTGFEARVIRFCLLSGRRDLTVEDVAEWFGMKARALSTRVKRRSGYSLAYWLNEGRVLYAMARHEDGLSYTRIAQEMEYAGASAVSMLIQRRRQRDADACDEKKSVNQ